MSYIYGEKNLWERFKDQFRSEETAADRTTALLTFMPKWKGFFNGSGEDMTATDAVVELHEVVSGSTNAYVIGEHDSVPKLKKPPYFNISKVSVFRYKIFIVKVIRHHHHHQKVRSHVVFPKALVRSTLTVLSISVHDTPGKFSFYLSADDTLSLYADNLKSLEETVNNELRKVSDSLNAS